MRVLAALGLLVVIGCSGGVEDVIDSGVVVQPADASEPRDGVVDTCQPVAQTGCAPSQRCAWRLVGDPKRYRLTCAANGDRDAGEPCAVDVETGLDDCMAGLLCWEFTAGAPVCETICDTFAVLLCGDGACMPIEELGSNIQGLCLP